MSNKLPNVQAWQGLALLVFVVLGGGCGPKTFTAAEMVMDLIPPEGFSWSDKPISVYNPAALVSSLGPDSEDLFAYNWVSTTFGQMDSEGATIKIAVHQLSSAQDAAEVLAENKYPGAGDVELGQEAHRWLGRNSDESIFFRRDWFFAQLTIDRLGPEVGLEPVAAKLDGLLAGHYFRF